MDMNRVYARLDELLQSGDIGLVEEFLIEMLKLTQAENDYNSMVMLLNEMIGLCRETGQKEKALGYSSQVIKLMNQLELTDSVTYANTLQNVANACRVAGKLDEAYQFFMEVFPIYEKLLAPDDYYYAVLYNNMSLLFQEMQEYERSVECLEKALRIIKQKENSEYEQAVTYTNIATSLGKLSTQTSMQERQMKFKKEELGYDKALQIAKDAQKEALKAIELFRELEVMDVHMAAACCSYADALVLQREYEQAEEYYILALSMTENSAGITEGYKRINEKLAFANAVKNGDVVLDEYGLIPEKKQGYTELTEDMTMQKKAEEADKREDILADGGISGEKLARAYFEAYGKRMLMEIAPEYIGKIAVGFYSDGSDYLDYGAAGSSGREVNFGFTLWMDDDVYAQVGEKLQRAYESLPKEFRGFRRLEINRGVEKEAIYTYSRFLQRVLGIDHVPQTKTEWLYVAEEALRAVANCEIFMDPTGELSEIIEKLKEYYPEAVWKLKIAQELMLFSKNGQYGYLRMMKHQDQASAHLLLTKACENAMKLIYLLNKEYAPHTQWLLRGMEDLKDTQMAEDLITALLHEMTGVGNECDIKMMQIEKLAFIILKKLKQLGLVEKERTDTYLAHYAQSIAYAHKQRRTEKKILQKEEIIPNGLIF